MMNKNEQYQMRTILEEPLYATFGKYVDEFVFEMTAIGIHIDTK